MRAYLLIFTVYAILSLSLSLREQTLNYRKQWCRTRNASITLSSNSCVFYASLSTRKRSNNKPRKEASKSTDMGPRSITHAKEKRKKEKKVGWVSVAAREGGDRPGRFFRLKGQVELQPIRQVGTHKACQKTEVRERERERRRREQGKRDTQGTRIRVTSFIDQSCLSHTLRLVCKTNYWKDSLARLKECTKRLFHIYIRIQEIQSCHAEGKITRYCSFNPV